MISKDVFVNTMTRLELLDKRMGDVDVALRNLCPDFNGFYVPETIDIVLDMLKDDFNDKYDWIEYFVYELDWLTKYREGCITDANGEPINLGSWEKVYDYLIENMEEQV